MMKVIEIYDKAHLSANGSFQLSSIKKNKAKVYQILIEKREESCDFENEDKKTSVFFMEQMIKIE